MKKEHITLLALCFVVFLDFMSYGLIFPIITKIFLDPEISFLPKATAENTRTLIFGLVSSAYPIAQFIGAPIIGGLSDRFGRKKMLTLTLCGSVLANMSFILGLVFQSATVMFVGRLIGGFMGGNAALANSMVGDISEEHNKARNYGFIGLAMAFGVVFGPFIGGRLTDPNFLHGANASTPFYFSTLLSLFAVIAVVIFAKETLTMKVRRKVTLFEGFKNIFLSFSHKNLRMIYVMTFLIYLSFNVFIYSLNIYLFKRIGFQEVDLGNFYAYAGIWLVVSLGLVNTLVAKKFKTIDVLKVSIIGMSLCFFLSLIPKTYLGIYILTPFLALAYGLSLSNVNALLSNNAEDTEQGEAFGVNQSLQSFIEAITPLFTSLLLSINFQLPQQFWYSFPNILAGISALVCWILFLRYFIFKPHPEITS